MLYGSNFNLPTTKPTVYRTVLIPIIFLRFLTSCHTVECPGHLEIQPSWAVPKKTTKEEVGSFHFISVLRMNTHTHTHTHTHNQCTENVTKASSFHLIPNTLGSDYFHFKITCLAGLPWWLSGKESACQCRRHGFDPQSGKLPCAEQSSPCATSSELVFYSPGTATREATTVRSPHTTTKEEPRSLPTRAKPTEQWKTRTAEQKQLPTKNKSNLTCKNSTKNSHISLTQYIINNHSKITKGQETNTNTILTTNLQSVNVTNHALIPLGSGCNPESNIAFICYFSLIIFDQGYFFSHSFFFFLTEQHAGS